MGKSSLFILICSLLLLSCQSGSNTEQTLTAGTTEIVVDNTFEPIIDDEWIVFKSAYPKANIKLTYRTENAVLNSFLNDSIRVAILSRELTKEEKSRFENKKIIVRVNRFAIDAIALIVSKTAADTASTVEDLINTMSGKPSNIKNLVFDNANSSTVRYLKELAGVKKLPEVGVYALKSNPDVVKYIHDHPGSVGVVGVNWLEQPDSSTEKLIGGIRILSVKNSKGKKGSDQYYQPDQSNIALGVYPLTRGLYIVNCSGGTGLGTGFATFLAGERGQRIVLKSGLLPDSIPSREILIKH